MLQRWHFFQRYSKLENNLAGFTLQRSVGVTLFSLVIVCLRLPFKTLTCFGNRVSRGNKLPSGCFIAADAKSTISTWCDDCSRMLNKMPKWEKLCIYIKMNISNIRVFLTIWGLHRTQLLPSSCSQFAAGKYSSATPNKCCLREVGQPFAGICWKRVVEHHRVHHTFWRELDRWEQFAFADDGREASFYEGCSEFQFPGRVWMADLSAPNLWRYLHSFHFLCFSRNLCHVRKDVFTALLICNRRKWLPRLSTFFILCLWKIYFMKKIGTFLFSFSGIKWKPPVKTSHSPTLALMLR